MEGQYTYGGDGQNGAVEKAPNHHEGWGRLDITRAVGSGFSEGIDIITDDSHSFKLSVPDTGLSDMRVVLAWHDPVNSASAGSQLRNDLDIYLKSPSGDLQIYTNDAINNLVGISASPKTEWEIIVKGEQVIDSI